MLFEKLYWDVFLTYLSDRSIITCCIACFFSIFFSPIQVLWRTAVIL